MRMPRSILALSALTLAAGCGGSPTAEGDAGASTEEVLPGSISDDMIALDQLRSQGEALGPTDAASENAGTAGRPAGGSASEPAASEAAAEPAAETPEAQPDAG